MNKIICHCKQQVYQDSQTGQKFDHDTQEYPHKCSSQPISLYHEVFGILVRRSEAGIAASITEEQIRLGILHKPLRTEKRGDKLFIKT